MLPVCVCARRRGMLFSQRIPRSCAGRARAQWPRHTTMRPYPTMRAPATHLIDGLAVPRLRSHVALLRGRVARWHLIQEVGSVGQLLAHGVVRPQLRLLRQLGAAPRHRAHSQTLWPGCGTLARHRRRQPRFSRIRRRFFFFRLTRHDPTVTRRFFPFASLPLSLSQSNSFLEIPSCAEKRLTRERNGASCAPPGRGCGAQAGRLHHVDGRGMKNNVWRAARVSRSSQHCVNCVIRMLMSFCHLLTTWTTMTT